MTERKERIEQILHDLSTEPVRARDEFKQHLLATLVQEQKTIVQTQTSRQFSDSFVHWVYSWWSRPTVRWASIAAVLILALVGILIPWTIQRPLLTIHQGVAQVSSQQPSAPESQKSQGDVIPIAEGVRITLDEDSTASLALFNGNMVELLAGTQLTITKAQPRSMWQAQTVQLQMTTGQVQVQVSPLRSPDERFEVDLPSALVSVRGTAFRVRVISPQHTYVATDEGVVAVMLRDPSQGNPLVEIPAGYQVDAIIGQPFQVRRQVTSSATEEAVAFRPSPEATRVQSKATPSPIPPTDSPVTATATSSPSMTVTPSPQVTPTTSLTGTVGSGSATTGTTPVSLVSASSASSGSTPAEPLPADLEIVQIDTPNPTAAEGTLTYSLLIANHGPGDARDIVVRDVLPSQVYLVDTTLPVIKTGSSQTTTTTVGWELGTLPAGDSRALQVTVVVRSWVTQSFTNTATVTAATMDQDHRNNQSTVETAVTDAADLAIAAQIPTVIGSGDVVTYTLVYTNLGPAAAHNITIVEELAAEMSFGGVVDTELVSPLDTVTTGTLGIEELVPAAWMVQKLAPGAFGRIIFTATVQPGVLGSLTSTVGITSDSPDSNWDNNDYNQVTLARPVANVSIAQSVTPDPVVVGSVLTYTLTYTNHGPWAAKNVLITAMLPLSVTLPTSATLSGQTAPDLVPLTPSGQSLAWFTPSLPSGTSGTVVLTVTVDQRAANSLPNRAIIHSTTLDGNPNDNTINGSVETLTPDLSLAQTVQPDVIAPHQPCTYTLHVTNTGTVMFAAQALSLVEVLPPGFHSTTITSTRPVTLAQTWTWRNPAPLAPGESVSISLVVSATETMSPDLYLSTAEITATVPGGPLAATASAPVRLTLPSVAVTQHMIGDRANVATSDRVTLTIRLVNTGPSPLAAIPLTERYDSRILHFVGAIPAPEESLGDSTIGWSNLIQAPPHGIGRDLFPGEALTVTLAFDVIQPLTKIGSVESQVTIERLRDVYDNLSDSYTIRENVYGASPLYLPIVTVYRRPWGR